MIDMGVLPDLVHLTILKHRFVRRALPVRDIPAQSPSVAMATRRGVTAAASTELMLAILSLAGWTASPWLCSR